MKRFIKAAAAVAAFGLAAAICAPAQARSRDILDGQDGTDGLSHVLGGLTFGLLDEGNVQLGTMGDQGPAFGTRDDQGLPGSMTSGWRVSTDRLWWTLTDAAGELAGTSVSDPTPGASVSDPIPGAPQDGGTIPGTSVSDPIPGAPQDGGAAQNGSLSAAQGPQNLSDILGTVPTTTTSAAETAQTSADAVAALGDKRAEIDGLVDAANQAVPRGAEQAGTLAPLVGTLSPAEAEPVAGAVAPIVRSASVDELAPLVGNSGEEGAKALTGTVHSLADTTMSTTRVAAE
ncbi:hypothetical protein [Streptosporangium minutum]|uniref:Uncharacterized protein n=1 Tax=Streptosporangium minutum TaxID=569862 RepID=A0A2C9ZLA8_9ACTN|nr:hypothetical protein [Streptosporangium minutum]OUC91453.1 hypothetical protein CA984_33740 [Streptosporangium minutum]